MPLVLGPIKGFESVDGLCGVQKCGRSIHSRHLCNLHYRRYLVHGNPLTSLYVRVDVDTPPECLLCERNATSLRLCDRHYHQYYNKGFIILKRLCIRCGGDIHVDFEESVCLDCGLGYSTWESLKERVLNAD
jgi:hypothetical protein